MHPSRAERLALFARLVRLVRARHVFTARTVRNLGRRWAAELPALKQEFAKAKTRLQLSVALSHFANSLKNPHCYYNTFDRPVWHSAGFEVAVAWRHPGRGRRPQYGGLGTPEFYVTAVERPALRQRVRPGDRVLAVDGVKANRLLERFFNESNGNNWRRIGADIARYTTRRKSLMTDVRAGQRGSWLLERPATGRRYRVRAVWQRVRHRTRGGNPLDRVTPGRCYDTPKRSYGPYRLTARGQNFCLYTSTRRPYRHYPIVRQVSFHYHCGRLQRCLAAERGALQRLLGAQRGLKGVILDLRDNHGGNNPNWFLDWWAPGPYMDHFVRFRLLPALAKKGQLRRANITGWRTTPGRVKWYLQQLAKRPTHKAQYTAPVPFFCRGDRCQWSNRYTPRRPVTRKPVALLVGPRCTSSCDHIAMIFSENRFGPLVGRPTAAGYTGYRSQHHLFLGPNRTWFGFLGLAFSYEISGLTRNPVEAVPLRLDQLVEKTRVNFSRYDKILVDRARRVLSTWRRRLDRRRSAPPSQ